VAYMLHSKYLYACLLPPVKQALGVWSLALCVLLAGVAELLRSGYTELLVIHSQPTSCPRMHSH
jgi:hypothetical protein